MLNSPHLTCCALSGFPRLSQRGLRVLVERCVHAKEFPQYEAFCAADSGARRSLSLLTVLVSQELCASLASCSQQAYDQ